MKWFGLFVWSSVIFSLQAQSLADVESKIVESAQKDTNWVLLLIKAGDLHADNKNFAKAHEYFQQALQYSQKMKYTNGLIKSYYFEGLAYRNEGNYKLSEENHLKAIELAQKEKNEDQLMRSYLNLGNTYRNLGVYDRALSCYLKSLEIAQKLGNKRIEGANYNNIGEIYRFQNNNVFALEFYEKALKISREINDERQIAINLNNIGIIHFKEQAYLKAQEYLKESLHLSEKMDNKRLLMLNYINLGNIFLKQSKSADEIELAIKYQNNAIQLAEMLKDQYNLSIAKRNLARCHMLQKDYAKAEQLVREALETAEKIGARNEIANGYYDMILIKIQQGSNVRDIIEYEMRYQEELIKIQNEELTRQIAKLQSSYEYKQKEIENVLLRKENKIKELQAIEAQMLQKQQKQENELLISQNNLLVMENKIKENALEKERIMREEARMKAEKERKEKELLQKEALLKKQILEKQRYFILGVSIIAVLVALLAFGLGRAYLNRKRFAQMLQLKNKEIEQQKEEILTQRDLLDEQNKLLAYQKEEILASIRYAKNIQTALLPNIKRITSYFKDFWVFYSPKDIVSGDFYYFIEYNGKAFLALADCTGHGVPGAFMSSLGISILENAITAQNISHPADILSELDNHIYKALNQERETTQQDGMEIALCVIDKKQKNIEFASANRSAFIIIDENPMQEILPTKQSIGGSREHTEKSFESQLLKFEHSCKIYLFSDGYQDQFGGEKQKKMGKKRFQEFLTQAIQLPFNEQEIFLREQFMKWKGSNEQTDDVSVLGAWIG